MATILQIRRGTTDITLADGEMYLQKDTNTLQISNGSNNPITLLPLNSNIEGNVILTGNITASNAYFTGDVAISGNLFLGNNSSDSINALGVFTSDIKPGTTNTYNIGSTNTQWAILYTNVVSASYISGSLIGIGNVSQFSSSVNQRLSGVESFSSSLNLSLTDLLFASTSVSNSVLYLSNFTGSQTTKNASLSTYTASVDNKFISVGASTSSLNTFTSSASARLTFLEQKSASIDINVSNLHTYTSSLKTAIQVSGQDLVVYGNLTVQGTQTSLNVGQVYIEDLALTLASGAVNPSDANGAGFNIAGANVSMSWDNPNSRMNLNKPLYITGDISASTIIGLNGVSVSSYSASAAARNTSVETYTASVSNSVFNINAYTQSSNISITNINTYTASVSNSVFNLNSNSASVNISVSNINTYTASVSNSVFNLNSYSASVSSSIRSINIYTASVSNSIFNINAYTTSVSNSILNLNNYSASVSNSLYWIGVNTSSINNFSSSDYGAFKYETNLHLLEIDSQIQYLSPEGGAQQVSSLVATASVHENRLNEISGKTGSYELKGSGLYSSSNQIVGILSSLNTYTGSNDTNWATLSSVTSSILIFTSSQENKNTTLSSYTASVNTKFATLADVTSSLISATSSYETKGRGIVSGSSQIPPLLPAGTVSGSSQVLGILAELNSYTASLKTAITASGADITINGNLTVKGTTTQIDSTQVNIGENIIELNYGGVQTTAGIYTKDATGASNTSGSLLWDATNDIWIAGKRGSEAKIITAADGPISGSSQIISILNPLNTYTGSNDTKWSTLSSVSSSLISKTGSYATTGSNIFVGNIGISGSLEVSSSFTASLQQGYVLVGDSTNKTKAVTTSSLATSLPAGLLSSSTTDFSNYTSSINSKFTTLQSVTASLITATSSFATTGSNIFVGNIGISGSLIVSSSFTASLQQGYFIVGDSNNKTSEFATASIAGLITSNAQTFVGAKTFTDLMEFRGGLRTGGTLHNNLNVPSGSGSYTISGIPDLRLLNVGTTHRLHTRGENDTIGTNASYATFIIGTSTNVENSTGTHPLVSQLAIKSLVLNDGTATTTNAATLYIEGPTSGSAGITNNYSVWVHTGSVKIEDNIIVGSITGSIAATNGIISGSSQVIGILSSLNTYTSSNETKWTTLANVTASLIAQTSSYATTGSNLFIGDQIITGSVIISGSTNPELIIRGEQVNSGSLTISGSLSVLSSTISLNTNGESRILASNFRPVGANGQNIYIGHAGTTNNGTSINSSYNTSVGVTALDSNTTGYTNTAVGYGALTANTTGYLNTAVGYIALSSVNGGRDNVGIGQQTLYQADATQTTAIGSNAGGNISAGTVTSSIYIGYNAYGFNVISPTDNEIVIGANAIGYGSNTVTLGNDNITKTILKGAVSASNGFTGSLLGTASYASNADLLDGVHLSTLATTGSNSFNGNQIITGSLTLSSSAAIELVVSGGVSISGSFSASLNQGYVWVGGSNNTTVLLSTSSIGGVTTLPSGLLSSSNTTFAQYTASAATTGSNSFNGNQIVTGSFTVSGSLSNFYNVSVINANTNASASNVYVLTSAVTLTLPSTPVSGSWIKISNLSNSTACILGRNGKKIMNVSEDMTLNDAQASFELVWTGDTYGWVLIGAR